jgi:hypothetical protein
MAGEKKQNAYGATYTVLTEPEASAELARCAHPQSNGVTDTLSLQPCTAPSERSQDRFIDADWRIADQIWRIKVVSLDRREILSDDPPHRPRLPALKKTKRRFLTGMRVILQQITSSPLFPV